MKKTTLALLLSTVVATPAMAQEYFTGFDMGFFSGFDSGVERDKSGFALTGGMFSYDSKIGKLMEADGGSENVFQLGADYTFYEGLILGLTSTSMQELDQGTKIGVATIFGGYELDCGVRLKAGLGNSVIENDNETELESGLMLGLGYVFKNGLIIEGAYNDIDIDGFQYGGTSISVGYKF